MYDDAVMMLSKRIRCRLALDCVPYNNERNYDLSNSAFHDIVAMTCVLLSSSTIG